MENQDYSDEINKDYERKLRKKKEDDRNRGSKITIIVILLLFFIIVVVYVFLKQLMPDYLMSQGKKYLERGMYEKALHNFDVVANAKPYDNEPVYYQALTLSKMPPTYDVQKQLYDISQLENCDEAGELAEQALANMRQAFESEYGSTYIDNVLYGNSLIRWNNARPITYSISGSDVSPEYITAVQNAFSEWENATGGDIRFKETMGNKNANIIVEFVSSLAPLGENDAEICGKTVPSVKDKTLNSMVIYLKKTDSEGNNYNYDNLTTLVLHEIGHALGLSGHSADPSDVMSYDSEYINGGTYRKSPSERDINTLRLVYRLIPDVIDTPIPQSEYSKFYHHYVLTSYPGENFEMEIQRLLRKLQDDRRNIVTWVDLAINYAYKRQYARSNYVLNNVIPLVQDDLPNQHVVLYNLAANYYKLRDYDTSLKYLMMAEHIKQDLDTKILETFLDVRFGNLDIAKEKLYLLLKEYPDNIDVALKLAEVYHIEKNRNMENKVIDDFVKANPDSISDRRILKYQAQKNFYVGVKDIDLQNQ